DFHSIQDEVKKIALEAPEHVLTGLTYHAADVHLWTTEISSRCLKHLKSVADGSAAFKFVANCTVLQKRNAGFHTNTSCFWDAERDGFSSLLRVCTGSVAVRWENATMTCIVTVYCISLQ
ncbi:TPA: hypothetical protein N0F65_002857, partial [Lagenidium giganteum]